MKAGKHISSKLISESKNNIYCYPCYGGNGIRGFVSDYSEDGLFVIIGRQGALCGNVQRTEGRFYATEHAIVVKPKFTVNMRWAFHILTEMNLNQHKTSSAQPGLAVSRLLDLSIELPPLEVQEKIVEILDKFERLVNDLTEGLPAEIEARRKQYEYYRNKLLTFNRLTA